MKILKYDKQVLNPMLDKLEYNDIKWYIQVGQMGNGMCLLGFLTKVLKYNKMLRILK